MPGDVLHVRVVAEGAAEPGVVVELARREEAEIGQDRIEPDRRVALAQHEAVAVRPVRLLRVEPQMRVVERGEQLGGGEGAGIVAGAGDARQPQGLQPHELGAIGQKGPRDVAPMRHRRPPSPVVPARGGCHRLQRKPYPQPAPSAAMASSVASSARSMSASVWAADRNSVWAAAGRRRASAPRGRSPALAPLGVVARTAGPASAPGRSGAAARPCAVACAAMPSRSRWPMARMCADAVGRAQLASRSRSPRPWRHAAVQNEPVTKMLAGRVAEAVVAGHGGQRVAVGDRLAPGGEVGLHADQLPAAAHVEAEAGAHVVDDQRGAGCRRAPRGRGEGARRQFMRPCRNRA